nr:peroxisome biogenesis factor 10-like isoform X4 [Arachis hypogaea]
MAAAKLVLVAPSPQPLAAQPEMMRDAEKNEQYASFVYEACRDALRHLVGLPRANGLLHAQGTRVAVAYQNETKSFWGQMLYYVLTTGSGQQTLGEEYCDTTQVHYFHCIPDSYSLYSRSY